MAGTSDEINVLNNDELDLGKAIVDDHLLHFAAHRHVDGNKSDNLSYFEVPPTEERRLRVIKNPHHTHMKLRSGQIGSAPESRYGECLVLTPAIV